MTGYEKIHDSWHGLLEQSKSAEQRTIVDQELTKLFNTMLEKIELMEKVINELVVNSDEMCEYCKHNIPCLGEECEFYESGIGMYDENGKYFDWKWSCMDFSFGDCRKLENTPCHECEMISGDNKFEWNGKLRGDVDG